MEEGGRYDAVRSGLWPTYVDFLVEYGERVGEGMTEEWAATLAVGAHPRDVVAEMMVVMGADDPDIFPGGPSDAWMDASTAEADAHLATVLSSHGEPDMRVRSTVTRFHGLGQRRDPDDMVRTLMQDGVSPKAAHEAVLTWRQWIDTVRSPDLPPLPTVSSLSVIEADPSDTWFARRRRRRLQAT